MNIEFVAHSAEKLAKRNSVRDGMGNITSCPRSVEMYSITIGAEVIGELERYGEERAGTWHEYCAKIEKDSSFFAGYGFADNRDDAVRNALANLQKKIDQAQELVNQCRRGINSKATISEAAFGTRELVEA